ncbi:MAG: hypothetical protein QNJ29_09625 [Rhizobiaceae bacterium]|nr:hypothetical protein [Rhizobiaceae bacterium]
MLKVFLKTLSKNQLDLHIKTGGGFETRIVERPGQWMEDCELHQLSNALKEIASHTLPKGSLSYGVFSGDPARLKNSVITLVRRKSDGKPIAFNALALMDLELAGKPTQVMHLGLVMVDPNEQSRGLSWVLYGLTCILLFVRNQMRPIWVSNVTQVPAIVGMVSETFSDIYPGPQAQKNRSLKHLLVARQIMKNHRHVFGVGDDAQFDEDRFVITNAYTGGSDELKKSFDDAPKHRKDIFNDFCAEQLNYERGDDVLQLGKIDLNTTRNYIQNSVPRASLGGLLLAALFVSIQRLFLPVLHWLDTTKHWGILMPAKK